MQVPIASITVPERVRRDLGDLAPLMDSLRRVGQLNPITVSPAYELIAGHRRLSAASKLGWKTVDVVVVSGLDEVRRLEMELEENLYRKDFTPDEVLAGWKRLDALRHPPLRRRIGMALGRFFGRLAFWKRGKKRPAGADDASGAERKPAEDAGEGSAAGARQDAAQGDAEMIGV